MPDQGRCDWCALPSTCRKQRKGYESAQTYGGQFLEACDKHASKLDAACRDLEPEGRPTPDLLSLFEEGPKA